MCYEAKGETLLEQAEIERRCEEIKFVICNSYKAYYMLQAIEKCNQAVRSGNAAYLSQIRDTLEYIAILLKNDFGLNVWKIYYEEAGSSNSLSRLINEVNKNRKRSNLSTVKRNKNDIVVSIVKDSLRKMRNTAIAHLDCNRNNMPIAISDLKQVLDIATDDFNSTCDILSLDDYKVSRSVLAKMEMDTAMGFGTLLKNSLVDIRLDRACSNKGEANRK